MRLSKFLAKINILYRRIVQDFAWQTVRNHLSLMDNVGAMADIQRFSDVVIRDQMPMPRAAKPIISALISVTEIGSTPAKGSSRRINLGSVASARAISSDGVRLRLNFAQAVSHVLKSKLFEQRCQTALPCLSI